MAGIKPKSKVNKKWSSDLAYAIGLLTTDGCLSKDGRHIDFTSKDMDQIKTFLSCLGIKNKISQKISGYSGRACPRIQFGDVKFYKFLLNIGLFPCKSKTLGELKIPTKYFFDFLRGSFDGDGTFYSYWDTRWKSSFMFYMVFISSSPKHIDWLKNTITKLIGLKGHVTKGQNSSIYQLKYAKSESLKLIPLIYYDDNVSCLNRKKIKIDKALLENKNARVV
ncbi:MAG: LAGLIDADG family homing endonuclease [Candidatus Sungbacteria bacterium]|uniref:LAGLIDADG family homing endonuclease n=1 Tax=Candidatus Sungiibacteriota bacterium TaxID=2750080 RepID=A0A9D6HPX0_9BACT|nr:LAGLIDADG family homing endonuclease [Candidatus Sungbacteria bacterium]